MLEGIEFVKLCSKIFFVVQYQWWELNPPVSPAAVPAKGVHLQQFQSFEQIFSKKLFIRFFEYLEGDEEIELGTFWDSFYKPGI